MAAAKLRSQAEARLRDQRGDAPSPRGMVKAAADSQRLFHELQVHQVELEMQNTELRQTRDELEVMLESFMDLYDFAPVGYFTLTAAGIIKQVNLTGTSLVGIERSNLVTRLFGTLVVPELRPIFHDFLKKVFAGPAKQSMDLELLSAGRLPRAVSLEAQRLLNGQECRIAVMDITGRKLAEDRVRVSEIRYRRLFETAHDGVLLLNPGTRKITDANPFMTKLLDYSHAQLVGKELFEIGLLKDESASQEMFQKLKRDREVRYENLPLENKSGRHQEVEVVANLYLEDGHAVIQCNIRDITERKRAEELSRRSEVLAASNRKLESEIVQRRAVEASLKQSEQHQRQLLEQSRQLSRQVLHAQEEERKRISRELHDVIAQTLTGINVRLATLKKSAGRSNEDFDRNLERTQMLIGKSVDIVHEFARELRPAVLDDLGLIPALHSFVKLFSKRTGLHVQIKAFAGVEQLDIAKRTALYRVAQEALTNVSRHAQASRVEISLQKLAAGISMTIKDDGKSFSVQQRLQAKGSKRLGLLGIAGTRRNGRRHFWRGIRAGGKAPPSK